jgi:hypothetical protein
MKKVLALAAVVLFAAAPLAAVAQPDPSREQRGEPQTYTQPPNESIRQGVRNDAAQVKHSGKNGTARVKRKLAVARCNDGRYSYTHHLTCNHHGGVRTRFR